jgi:hypothetical protein
MRIAMIAITTSSSIRVNAERWDRRIGEIPGDCAENQWTKQRRFVLGILEEANPISKRKSDEFSGKARTHSAGEAEKGVARQEFREEMVQFFTLCRKSARFLGFLLAFSLILVAY